MFSGRCVSLHSGCRRSRRSLDIRFQQELMGGCSMRCAFPWTTTALVPGKSPAARLYADDNDASTAWIDPNPTVGTKLQFQFPGKLPPELNGTPPMASTSSEVIRPLEAFKNYARIKKAKQCSRRFSTDECSVAGIGSRRSGPKRVLTSEAAPQTSKICYRMAIQH